MSNNRNQRGGRGRGGRGGHQGYDNSQPEEESPYSDLSTTKAYNKEKARSKNVGFGNISFGGFGGFGVRVYDGMDDVWSTDDELGRVFAAIRAGRFPPKRVAWDYKTLAAFPAGSGPV